ncbi:MAG: ABC transporter permease [Planctomycetota bacterium]|jgi:putative ABC transport system permease protein|nr:ABC transporter permease [Planctomycetota bacterium]
MVEISLSQLAIAFIPVLGVLAILFLWRVGFNSASYGLMRMLGQLLLVGYFLSSVFESDNAWVVIAVLALMISAASWIALRTVADKRKTLFGRALLSVAIAGGLTLVVITQLVLNIDPWYDPKLMLPLAGMIFASAMNSVSLAGERFYSEIDNERDHQQARASAFRAAMIPVINSLFAVGLVSLPGMMTGQILAGVSPLIAARYQIMVMCMIFSASGLASAMFLLGKQKS